MQELTEEELIGEFEEFDRQRQIDETKDEKNNKIK